MPLLLATSYEGFWLFIVCIAGFVLALVVGAIAAIARQIALATACGAILILCGLPMLVPGLVSESVSPGALAFGLGYVGLGVLYCWWSRRRPRAR